MSIYNHNEWLDRQLKSWTAKGWISDEAQQHIRNTCQVERQNRWSVPLYTMVAVVASAFAGIGLIWGAAYVWYHISDVFRMALAVLLLLLSQAGVGAAMFQNRQGSLLGEGIAAAHCLLVFVSLAMAEQTFYIGWNATSYIAACAFLSLPAAYLLRSMAVTVIYGLAVLCWAAFGGPLYAVGGVAFLWVLIALPLPLYYVLVRSGDELRLSVFSWTMTITVFAAFFLVTRNAVYIPFLLVSSLAVAIMLTGYSIDIRKSWGVPFRWLGRFVAAAALLISCMPASWYGVAGIQGFHWTATVMTVLLLVASGLLLAKGVKKRFWGPVIYAVIPVLLGGETILVRSGIYSSVPLVISSCYMLFLGFYETMQGIKEHRLNHTRFGVAALVSLIAAFLLGTSFSPVVPSVAVVILALVIIQLRRTAAGRKAAASRAARRMRMKHTAATVRTDKKRQQGDAAPSSPPELANLAEKQDAAFDADTLAEWMQNIRMPSPDEAQPAGHTAANRPSHVTVPPPPASQFVAPVFHSPDSVALPPEPMQRERRKESQKSEKTERITTSPWQHMAAPAKREKTFSRSPWAQEGERK